MRIRAVLAAALVLVALGGCSTGEPITPNPPAPTVAERQGMYTVGKDIAPGTYTTTGPFVPTGWDRVPLACYWSRYESTTTKFGEEVGDLIDNGIVAPGKKGRMAVEKSDGVVEFTGDCDWKQEQP